MPVPRPSFRVLLVLVVASSPSLGACSSAGGPPSVALASPPRPRRAAPTVAPDPAPSPTPVAAPSRSPSPTTRAPRSRSRRAAEDRVADAGRPPRSCSRSAPATGSSATDDGSDYPAEAAALPDVATFASVDVEKIVALEPDLVVAGGLGFTPADSIAKLRALGVPVARHLCASRSTASTRTSSSLGDATGSRAEADALTDAMRADMDAVARRPPRRPATEAAGLLRGRLRRHDRADLRAGRRTRSSPRWSRWPAATSITTGDPTTLRDPAREAHRARPAGDRPRRRTPFYEPTADEVAKRNGWERHDGGQERRHPARQRHRDHPARVRACPPGCATSTLAIYPDLTLPPAP